MSWQFDAPSGTYKNHALSTDIRRQAIADAQVMKFFRAEPGYGKGRGESVTITRILKLPNASTISELESIPSGRPVIETKQVSVNQWGYKISVTEFEQALTHFNIQDKFQAALRDQITLTMDEMCADALKLTPYKFIPTTSGGTFDTDGTPSTLASKNLSVSDLRQIYDRLNGTLKCPKFRGGRYVGILSTRAARGIKNDPEYKDWLAPTTSSPLMTGMLKSIEGFDLYETNNTDSFDDLVGSSTVTGEAVFFGADAGGLVQVMAPELRMGIPDELGTQREIGWVGAIQAFLVWETASLARVIHVSSS
jgi:N4-gp56 family major capsid protein